MKLIEVSSLILLKWTKIFPKIPKLKTSLWFSFILKSIQADYILEKKNSGPLSHYYLGNGIDSGAGWVSQLSAEIYAGRPFFVHWETGSETIYWGVAHP